MKTADIRSGFLKFFEGYDHRIVTSDSLIPSTDPTLLFTSAGMVQFKPNFQNPDSSPFKRATTSQKCLRTSDIERVGTTLRHLTFFEMLGNFSFGDYFKKESIGWGWEFLTKTMHLPGDRFVVSVFKEDDEAFSIWEKLVPKNRIYRLEADTNFWTMGPTGPCGPCSEILWDRGPEWSCGKSSCNPACDCDRYLEVWNHVFTQFDRSSDGKLNPLPRKNIDTGMGLERLTLLLQGVSSPFGTDMFQSIGQQLSVMSKRPSPKEENKPAPVTPEKAAFRRIADHSRAVTFMVGDGILPSNEGRGYVLRRLLRQAVRAGKTLGISKPFVHEITGTVVGLMKEAYPELSSRRDTIASVVKAEEEKFLETLDTGTRRLEEIVVSAKSKKASVLVGKEVFQLYETYGFPFELTKEMAESLGLLVDEEGFKQAQQQAADVARQGWKGSGAQDVDHYRQWRTRVGKNSAFHGYDSIDLDSEILLPIFRKDGERWVESDRLAAGQEGEVFLPDTPFYAEAGGQVGDNGWIENETGKADVIDTQAHIRGFTVQRVRVVKGTLMAGSKIRAKVDEYKRERTKRHHTATHLLHQALRDVLGPQVTQAGSLVAPDRLRFDFNHTAPLTREERQQVEDLVNEKIINDIPVKACRMPKDHAQKIGAMMLFGEKYEDNVRVVIITHTDCAHAEQAWSKELCGGTHVPATGHVGFFKILGQSSVSAGVRRLEALAGMPALQAVRKMEQQLATVAETLKATPEEVVARVEKLLNEKKQLERDVQAAKTSAFGSQMDDMKKSIQTINGLTYLAAQVDEVDDKQLREVADRLRDSLKVVLVVISTSREDKASFVVSLKKEAVSRGLHAGQIAKEFASMIDGSGGGRAEFAQGGGRNIKAVSGALAKVQEILKRQISPS